MLARSMYIKKHDKVSSFHIRPDACINIFDFYVYSLVESKLGGKNEFLLHNNSSFAILDVPIHHKV